MKKLYKKNKGSLAFTPDGVPVVICGYCEKHQFLIGAVMINSLRGFKIEDHPEDEHVVSNFYSGWKNGYYGLDRSELGEVVIDKRP